MRIPGICYWACCLAFLGLACEQEVSKPNYEYSPDMAYSLAYESFSANPHFPDGKTLRPPPQGTVPRGHQPFPYVLTTPEEALRAGVEMVDPLPQNAEANAQILERGTVLFTRLCIPCHAMDLQGGGLMTRVFSRPPSLLASNARNMKDGQLFHVITLGQGSMHGYGQQISQKDRWKIIRYIRAFQASSPTVVLPAETSENVDTPSQGAL
ncbi:MAG: cytochrome c [Cystobacterineae bacterium]|nr:cytochrome c [Cystobacterineae bacterium]